MDSIGKQFDRRQFVQGGAAAALGAAVAPNLARALPIEEEAPAKDGKKPNLIFLYTEGQRWDCLSSAGHPLLKTPNMDRIAHEGVKFENAFCTNALCAPARASAMTGMWSRSTGALDNKTVNTPLPSDIPVFTDYLLEAGYETCVVGKVHMRNGMKEKHWDYYLGVNAPATNYYKPKMAEGKNGKIGPVQVWNEGYCDDFVTDRVLDWLKQPREKPFALLLWYMTPHAPYFRARRHLDLYNGVKIPKPASFDDDLKGYPGKPTPFKTADNKIGTTDTGDAVRSIEELCKDYYSGLVAIDENVGRIFKHLDDTKAMDDTAVIHSSDHGYLLGEWRLFDKRLMHEPSIRVPMAIRYPNRVKAGAVKKEMVLDVDIAPTVMDLVGLPIPKQFQGRSMLDVVDNKGPAWRKEWLYDYYEFPGAENVAPHRGVRTDTHKFIQWYTQSPQEFELYDLKNDPNEAHNLYGDPKYAAIQKDLEARLAKLLTEIPERKA
ncbi:sulfatase [Terriglobus roseus]|uniref:Arylsulfatase A n=1 Tax=Terriglobus roseus TaxID=392734 RepID=A0A1G7GYB4_9BACT|nr:sulfatase [Terriglobus roseus]SDE93081.1 Arylsulfatase A [Terriglobus roseus]